MKNLEIKIPVMECSFDELSATDRVLVEAAKNATRKSYSPYSHFHVGAALLLADGMVVIGANQENAAFSPTMCAERAACFNAGCNHKGVPIKAIAIAAWSKEGTAPEAAFEDCFQADPIAPCGVCRQALLEFEKNQPEPIRVILYGSDRIYILPSVASLLPITFLDFK